MINILYFANIRETLSETQEALELEPTLSTVQHLIALLSARGERWQHVFEDQNVLVAVNQEMATANTVLADGDEVAFFPPVTGG